MHLAAFSLGQLHKDPGEKEGIGSLAAGRGHAAYLDRVFVLGRHIRKPDKFARLGKLPRAEHERSVMAAVMAFLPIFLVFRSLQSRATWGHREVRIVSEQAQHSTADRPDRWGSS